MCEGGEGGEGGVKGETDMRGLGSGGTQEGIWNGGGGAWRGSLWAGECALKGERAGGHGSM